MFATTPALAEPAAVRELRSIIEAGGAASGSHQHTVVLDKRTPQHIIVHHIPSSCEPTPETAALLYSCCPNTHYLYCTLMDGPVRGGNAAGETIDLQHVQNSVAASVDPQRVEVALQWRRAFLQYERPGQRLPDQIKFKCLGRRGGDNHSFTSDEMKRAVAAGLAQVGMAGSVVDPSCTVLAHLHFGQLHIGLRLNSFDCTLGPPAVTSAITSADGVKNAPESRQKLQPMSVPRQDDVPEEEPPPEPADAPSDALSALDAVAPWASREYSDQLNDKHRQCMAATVKFVRKLKKSWLSSVGQGRIKKSTSSGKPVQVREGDWVCAGCASTVFATKDACFKCGLSKEAPAGAAAEQQTAPMPQWLHKPEAINKQDQRRLFEFGSTTVAAPAEGRRAYRNKVVLTIGRDADNKRVAGFRVASGVVAALCSDCEATCPAEVIELSRRFSSEVLQANDCGLVQLKQMTFRASVRTGQLVVTLAANELSDSDIQTLTSWFQGELAQSQTAGHASSPSPDKLLPWSRQTAFGSPQKARDGDATASKGIQLQAAAVFVPGEAALMLCGTEERLTWQERIDSATRPDVCLNFSVSPASFFQVNTAAAEQMLALIARCAFAEGFTADGPQCRDNTESAPNQILLDLCCGTGTIGLALAGAGRRCVGVDICEPAIRDALSNRDRNGLEEEADFVCGKVGERVDELIERASALQGATDIVAICDPPRNGMRPAVADALRRCEKVSRIVYVSCNPCNNFTRYDYVVGGGALFENAKLLCGPADQSRGGAFQLSFAQPVDMFPSTPHVELVVVFDRVTKWV